jgi:heme exporter protein D
MNQAKKFVLSLLFALAILPAQVFAHGTAEGHQREMMMNTYVLIGTGILFILFFVLYTVVKYKANALENVKRQEEREKRQQLTKTANTLKWAWILSLVGVVISGAMSLVGNSTEEIKIKHVHGLGYSNDGKRIFIPVHDGLVVYSDGQWSAPEGKKHDYMGFSMVDNGFYSSGHPAPGSDLVNPLGVVKSTDEGKTIETLDLEGEMDFHGMAASYNTHTIYVFNTQPNSRMETPGMYYTKDETKTWEISKLQGLNDRPSSLAVHPTNDSTVAMGTQSGVYLSNDYGNNFEKVLADRVVTSMFFNNQGKLLVGDFSEKPSLLQLEIETKKTEEIKIPALQEEEVIVYIAQNPTDENELVFITSKKASNKEVYDVYVTEDKGQNWKEIVKESRGISEQADKGGNES